jgi:CHASE3 domain sensor protein
LVVVAIPMTGVLLLGAAFWLSVVQQEQASEDLAVTLAEQDQLDLVYEDVLNIETGMRGFLLSGRRKYLKPYLDGVASIGADLDILRDLESDDPWETSRFTRLRTLIEREMNILAEQREGAPYPTGARLASLDRSKKVMDEIRIVQKELDTNGSAQLAERRLPTTLRRDSHSSQPSWALRSESSGASSP